MLAAAILEGRSQGRALHGVAADRPPAELAAAGAAAVIDLFSDPCGWLSGPEEYGDVSEDRGEPGTSTSSDSLHRADGQRGPWQSSGLGQLAELAGRQAPEPLCLVIDSLSALLLRHPAAQVLALLDALQRSPVVSSILALVHRDLHSPQLLCALQSAASALLELQPLTPLQRQLAAVAPADGPPRLRPPPLGRLRFAAKRRSGRLRAEQQYYSLLADGGVEAYAPPAEALAAPDARALVATALAAKGGSASRDTSGPAAGAALHGQGGGAAAAAGTARAAGGGGADEELARRLGGASMRLGLSAEERAARQSVILPFEQQRRGGGAAEGGRAASAGAAAVEVAGRGAPSGARLGQILYTRDSEGEADSDEDPDDDLDL